MSKSSINFSYRNLYVFDMDYEKELRKKAEMIKAIEEVDENQQTRSIEQIVQELKMIDIFEEGDL